MAVAGDDGAGLICELEAGTTFDEAREAEVDDHAALAASLAEAFQGDPVAGWVCPDDAMRDEVMRRFYAAFLPAMQRHQWTWTTPGLEGAAIWAPPGQWRTRLRDLPGIVRPFLRRGIFARLPMLGVGMAMVDEAHPREPDHFYLAVLGVSLRAQGRGLGSRLLRPTLEICDRDGVPAYLESSKESNIAFYARHGFRVTGELTLPRGPTVYKMWREPNRREEKLVRDPHRP